VSLQDVGVDDEVDEVGSTLEANAIEKARTYARLADVWAIADDSGLEVDFLGGAPGPFTKRYAGENASDEERVRHLLAKMEGVPWEQRGARFRCVIAISEPNGELRLCEGSCPGIIATEPKGLGGFGFDPIFFLPDLTCTMAELTLDEKNRISHRARAAQVALATLQELTTLGNG